MAGASLWGSGAGLSVTCCNSGKDGHAAEDCIETAATLAQRSAQPRLSRLSCGPEAEAVS